MKIKNTFILTIVTLLLLAFPVTAFAAPNTYPVASSAQAAAGAAASSSTSTSTSSTSLTSSGQNDTPKLLRDGVTIDLAKSYLVVSKTYPANVTAVISGWLPDPCHILRVSSKFASASNAIDIEVYSLYDPTQACIAVLEPFTTKVSLGSFEKGQYTVLVNGMKLGEFGVSAPSITAIDLITASTSTSTSNTSSSVSLTSAAQTGAQKLLRDGVTIDLESSYLLVSKTYPVNVTAVISGWLPDPCHILRVSSKFASASNAIDIEVYSLYDPTQACTAVLEPFITKVSLGSFDKGQYTVLVNGMKLGGFGVSVPSITAIAPTNSFSTSTSATSYMSR